jgi:hypothetical protein
MQETGAVCHAFAAHSGLVFHLGQRGPRKHATQTLT